MEGGGRRLGLGIEVGARVEDWGIEVGAGVRIGFGFNVRFGFGQFSISDSSLFRTVLYLKDCSLSSSTENPPRKDCFRTVLYLPLQLERLFSGYLAVIWRLSGCYLAVIWLLFGGYLTVI